jgi:DNA-directed RNA polymerase subunit RPC12/RpoP
MFDDDGLWPCKCSACEHEWYASIAAMRADREAVCPTCSARNLISPADFNSAVSAARGGSYDFSYLVRISPQFRFGTAVARERPGAA